MEKQIAESFAIDGSVRKIEPYGNGHINTTFLIFTKKGKYVLQKINKAVFRDPASLMKNFTSVSEYLIKKAKEAGKDPSREVLTVIKTKDGENFYLDSSGDYWRMLNFVEGSISYDKVENPEQFYLSAKSFGDFQYQLRDYPAETLFETIKDFHNTPERLKQLRRAAEQDSMKRAEGVKAEIEFAYSREKFINMFEDAYKEGKLPIRITHNDTKLNNILFDKETGEALCVIDFDTIMPGYAVNDFGDSIRFGATTAFEDETDLSKVNFDIGLYEIYVKGFMEGLKGGLSDFEVDMLPYSAIMMTLECGMRFLADYLSGDIYFRIHRTGHNLDRARNQFKLVSDMENVFLEMQRIVNKYKK